MPIDLTPKEFALLHLFMRRPGVVFSREVLIEHAWDGTYQGDSNIVDVYIRFLRKKIDEGFWPRLLLTRRRQGYLMRGGKA
jgi:two-component system OmpR family response regulator